MISDSGLWRARTAAPMIPVSSCGAATPRGIQGLEGDEWLPLGVLLLLSGLGRISSSSITAMIGALSEQLITIDELRARVPDLAPKTLTASPAGLDNAVRCLSSRVGKGEHA